MAAHHLDHSDRSDHPESDHPESDHAENARAVQSRFATALSSYATGTVTDDAELAHLGVDSLALVRIVIQVVGDDCDREIDLGDVGELRTVGELRRWLAGATDAGVSAR